MRGADPEAHRLNMMISNFSYPKVDIEYQDVGYYYSSTIWVGSQIQPMEVMWDTGSCVSY